MSTELVTKAERAIDAILSQLERDTGECVQSVEIIRTDITKLGDERKKHMAGTFITMFRTPGNEWAGQ